MSIFVIKRNGAKVPIDVKKVKKVIDYCCIGTACDPIELEMDSKVQFANGITTQEIQKMIIQTAVEKISESNPQWQMVASKLYLLDVYKRIALSRRVDKLDPYETSFLHFIKKSTKNGYYHKSILQVYSEDDIENLGEYIQPTRDHLFTYVGIKTLVDRYLISSGDGVLLELPQEGFMGIAMYLASKEKQPILWAKKFYDIISKLEVLPATPTLSNARRVHSQLSSCFIGTIDDNLNSIFDSINTFAQLSKYGGGVGMEISRVRSLGSSIRGVKNVGGGTIPWIRILNDCTIAVDQLGCVASDSFVKVLDTVVTDKYTHQFHKEVIRCNFTQHEVIEGIASHASNYAFAHGEFTKNTISCLLLDYVNNAMDLGQLCAKYNMSRDQYKKIIGKYKKIDKKLPDGFYTINEYSDYAICENGVVIHVKSFKYLASHITKKGYVVIVIGDKHLSLHRLLVKQFIQDDIVGLTVDHIDEDKTNNRLDNLQVMIRLDNQMKSWMLNKDQLLEKARIHKTMSMCYRLKGERRDTHAINIETYTTKIIPISKISNGDLILSYNIKTNKTEFKPVISKYKIEVLPKDQIKITTCDGYIVTSNWHPYPKVMVNGSIEYIKSELIVIGDTTINCQGGYVQVTDVCKVNEPIDFLDLTIKDNNNYFCSTHNKDAEHFNLIHNTRKGALTINMNIYHADILDFLSLKTNNGDDRRKAHDIFPAIGIPDNFMKTLENRGIYYLFDPHEVVIHLGYEISDYYGEEFVEKYCEVVACDLIKKTKILALDIFKMILKSAFETGTPYVFYRDTANRLNPNKHCGVIRSTNLCVEIMQNMNPSTNFSSAIVEDLDGGNEYLETEREPGDLVVCNLSSLNLQRVNSDKDIRRVIPIQVRMLDNVVDLNFYPVPDAEYTNKKYRAIGLGTMGYHALLAQNDIAWDSEEHYTFVNDIYEQISYFTIQASMELSKEKGRYSLFEGSDWEKGKWMSGPDKHTENFDQWKELKSEVKEHGLRNGYLLAIAPTGSISLIAGTTAGIDPINAKIERTEKKSSMLISAVPNLEKHFWSYLEAHKIDQQSVIKAAGIRQRWIDQSQSMNLFTTAETSSKELYNMYFNAWKEGCKSIYYLRSKSVEIEECTSCQ